MIVEKVKTISRDWVSIGFEFLNENRSFKVGYNGVVKIESTENINFIVTFENGSFISVTDVNYVEFYEKSDTHV